MTVPAHEVQQALARDLAFDLVAVRLQLRDALLQNKVLRLRLRTVLNCTDPRCSTCATCLAAVRED